MEITAELRGNICMLRLRGALTAESTEDFGRSRAESRQWRPSATIVDLFEVPFIDSTGLGYLLGFYTSSAKSGEGFGIIHVNAKILELLQLCQLDRILPLFDTEETALAALGSGPGRKPAAAM